MPKISNDLITVELDPRWPRIITLARHDTGGSLAGCSPDQPFVLDLNGMRYANLTGALHLADHTADYTVGVPELALTLHFRFALEGDQVILTMPRVDEDGVFRLERLGIPEHRLVTAKASHGDHYLRYGFPRVNWARHWVPGSAYFDGWEDFGPVGEGTPDPGPRTTTYACAWNTKICAAIHTSLHFEALITTLESTSQLRHGRAGEFAIWMNEYPYRLRGSLAGPFVIRIGVLGDYNHNGVIDWCDAAAWQGDLLVPEDRYKEQIIYKLYLDDMRQDYPVRTFGECLDVIRTVHDVSGGIRQVVYLVGWQDSGHDTGFPVPVRINPRVGGPDKLNRLIEESKQYNAVISIHHNMDDSYPEFAGHRPDLLARDQDGTPFVWFVNGFVKGLKVYSINHTLQVEAGYAQSRIDSLLQMVPLTESIHLDAHRPCNEVWLPDGTHIGSECEIQRGMLPLKGMFAARGLDITTEGSMIGIFNWSWHATDWRHHYVTAMEHGRVRGCTRGGRHEGDALGRLFVVDESTPGSYATILRNFFTHWMYAEILSRKKMVSYRVGSWNESVEAHYADDGVIRSGRTAQDLYAQYEGIPIARGTARFLPWRDDTIFFYSPDGGAQSWTLPTTWQQAPVRGEVLRQDGSTLALEIEVNGRDVRFTAPPNVACRLTRG